MPKTVPLELSDAALGTSVALFRRLAASFSVVLGPRARAHVKRIRRARGLGARTGHSFQARLGRHLARLELSPSVGAALLDRILAGNPCGVAGLGLTDLGAFLVEPLLEEWLGSALDRDVQVGAEVDGPIASEYLECALTLEIDGIGGGGKVWLPDPDLSASPALEGPRHLPGWLARRTVPIEAQIGKAFLSLGDLRELRPGDLVGLDRDIGTTWVVTSGGGPLAAGHPCATKGGLLAMLFTDVEEEFL